MKAAAFAFLEGIAFKAPGCPCLQATRQTANRPLGGKAQWDCPYIQ